MFREMEIDMEGAADAYFSMMKFPFMLGLGVAGQTVVWFCFSFSSRLQMGEGKWRCIFGCLLLLLVISFVSLGSGGGQYLGGFFLLVNTNDFRATILSILNPFALAVASDIFLQKFAGHFLFFWR